MPYTAITHIGGEDITTGANKITQPATMEVELETISASDAGRTADTLMHKKSLREVVAVSLAWHNLNTLNASKVLQKFMATEYFTMRYLDPYVGGYTTKTFYVGNRNVPMYSAELDVWSNVAFKVIER